MSGNKLKSDLPRPENLPVGVFHPNAKPLIGKRFGKLEVVEERGRNSKRMITYLCLCDCGKSVIRVGSTLLGGKSTSCGCNSLTPEIKAKRGLSQRKEGTVFRKEYRHYLEGAKQREIGFFIPFSEFKPLLLGSCHYCGSLPNREILSTYESVLVNGIDRVDNNLPYQVGNLVSCCSICNYMKRAMNHNDFVDHCQKVVRHSRQK